MQQSLRRPFEDRVLAGVCSGLGRFFGIDPVAVRVGWIILTLVGGTGLLLYLLSWLLIPDDNGHRSWLPAAILVLLALPVLCTLCFGMLAAFGAIFNQQ